MRIILVIALVLMPLASASASPQSPGDSEPLADLGDAGAVTSTAPCLLCGPVVQGTPASDHPVTAPPETPAPAVADVRPRPRFNKEFWLLGAALNVAMILDTRSTFDVLRRCPQCAETNPYVAPFIKRGPAVAFAAGEGFDIGVMAIAAWMRRSENPAVRRIWWFVPVALTTGHLVAYGQNRHVAK